MAIKFYPIEIKADREAIMEISAKTAQTLDEKRGLEVSVVEIVPAVAYEFIKGCIEYLNLNKKEGEEVEINLFDLMTLAVEFEGGVTAEKDGNYVPKVTPGRDYKLMIKADDKTEEQE